MNSSEHLIATDEKEIFKPYKKEIRIINTSEKINKNLIHGI